MKHSTKKNLGLLTALLLLAGTVCACGESATVTKETEAQGTTDTVTTEEAEPEYVPASVDLGGRDFYIYSKMEGDPSGRWTSADFAVEEADGDVVNDAIFARNSKLEEMFNCNIVNYFEAMGNIFSYTLYNKISKLIQSGDTTYDFYMPTIQDCAKLASAGMLWDLSAYDTVHLDQPWWNQVFEKATSVGGAVYYANGDISETFMRAAYAIFFNKTKISDYDLENPYTVVESGNWTIEKLLQMSTTASEDLNGNGHMDSEDHIGLMVLYNSTEAFFAASGVKLVTVEDGELTWTGSSEKSIGVMEKIYNLYETEAAVLCCDKADLMLSGDLKSKGNVQRGETLFSQGSALYLFGTMNNVKAMRSMDTADFGILPLPKADSSQSDYYSYVHTWSAAAACIPINVANPDASAAFMEAAAYYAQQMITPAYYDVFLKTKVSRDEESSAMLDMIYSKRWCDLGNIYNVGSVLSEFTTKVNAGKNDFASMIAKKEAKIASELATINEAFAGIND